MTKINVANVVKRLEAHQKQIAKKRDELRDLESDISQLGDDADEALDSLSYAIDALSRLQ
jgi:predicted  nucleic acid-binding Zn-ribbon protein